MHEVTRHSFKKLFSALITNLPEEQKVLLSLYYVEELTFQEIAEVMGKGFPEVVLLYREAIKETIK